MFFQNPGWEDTNAKQDAGLGDDQAQGWKAWHHLLQQRIEHQETFPLLSCADVKVLLAHFLPRRNTTAEEVIRQMKFRHRQRQASIESAYRRKWCSAKDP